MLRSVRRLLSRTPPRTHIQLLGAICDEHWLAVDEVQRFHDTSPEGRGVYHVICAVVTRRKCGGAHVWLVCIGALDVFLYNVGGAVVVRFTKALFDQGVPCRFRGICKTEEGEVGRVDGAVL